MFQRGVKINKIIVESMDLAKKIAELASDKKAEKIVILDMRKVVNFCDFFVICSGTSNRQVRAIADHIDEELSKAQTTKASKQSKNAGDWIVFDAGDVVTHVFEKDVREFYQLEYLWREAVQVEWENKPI